MADEKIMIGMSGGVDSSVAAALLLKQGYTVVGATLRLYDGEEYERGVTKTCCSLSDVEDARAVCYRLGIEHHVFNFKERFENTVISDFISEYRDGRTPNPCIVCNRCIKFDAMLERAQVLGCDKIATGHYAVTERDGTGRYLLSRPADRRKDQTYVLYRLTQYQLAHTLFPLAAITKEEARAIAVEYGLRNAHKPDSQDICFVPDGDYAGFIERRTGEKSPCGDYIDAQGNVLGRHRGMIRYTIGQRKGLGIALGKPMFVLDKNAEKNEVMLGEENDLFYRRVLVNGLHFIPFDRLCHDLRVTAKLRYRHAEQPATLHPLAEDRLLIEFDEPQRAPSPGQAAVFYDGETVVGGGTIMKGLTEHGTEL